MTVDEMKLVNILLVDDQPAKLLSYETILAELDETLIKANSAREALELLLKNEIAVILVDVCHAGTRRFRAGPDDPAASTVPDDGDHLRFRGPGHRS